MTHTLDQPDQVTHAARLDQLIARVEEDHVEPHDLLLEHLTAARAFLVGAMPEEYSHNLQLAREVAGALSDKSLQHEVDGTLSTLVASVSQSGEATWKHHQRESHRPSTPVVPVSRIAAFFQGSEITHGIFYPKRHLVGVFATLDVAQAASKLLQDAGFADHEILAASGGEMLIFLDELRAHTGVFGELMTQLSRFLDTEASLVDRYRNWAMHGAGFLVVYCPAEEEAVGTSKLLKRFDPLAEYWCAAGYIRDLTR